MFRSSTSSSESSSPKSRIKRSKDIPNNIKVIGIPYYNSIAPNLLSIHFCFLQHEVRKIYATLLKENETFLGWEIRKGYIHYCHDYIFALHVLTFLDFFFFFFYLERPLIPLIIVK